MKIQRITTVLIIATLLVSMCGCSSIYSKEYSYVTDYVNSSDSNADGKNIAKSYYTLKQAILSMVNDRKETDVIVFDGYDGDISTDLLTACWELRTKNALCSYCVESITYDINHIVSYDEATVYIKYSRSAEDMNKIVRVAFSTDIKDYLYSTMNNLQNKVTLLVNNSTLDEDGVSEMVAEVYEENPLCTISLPKIKVLMYTGSGLQRLFEVSFDYGDSSENIYLNKGRVNMAVSTAVNMCQAETDVETAYNLCNYLIDSCKYEELTYNNTVYDTLIRENANSEGLALAYKAICNELGIDCSIINGISEMQSHTWNIICIDGEYYHVDVSRCRTNGIESGFLQNDKQMWELCRWDTAKYSECRGSLTFEQVFGEEGEISQ